MIVGEETGARASSSLVGRDAELASLDAFLERSFRDGGALLLVGDAGVGKSALLNAVEHAGRERGAVVIRTRGTQYEVEISFAALNQALLPLLGGLAALAPPHREALNVALGLGRGGVPDRLLISNALLALLKESAEARPVLVVADDLQWLDRSSASALSLVARRLAGSHVALIGALRTDDETFFDRGGLAEMEIQPLGDQAAAHLVDAAFPALSPSVRARILGDAEGNPLALLELPAALTQPQRSALQNLPATLPLSRRLTTMFAHRIAELPVGTRQTLLRMAFDGTGDPRVLSSVDDGSGGGGHLDAAERARLAFVDATTHRPVFRHPLIRSAVVGLSTEAERRGAHAALAEVFASQPDRHAWHLAEAAVAADEQVAELLASAAYRILRRGDAVGAIAALTRAAELSPRAGDRARRLAEAAYLGADVTGDLRRAKQLLADAHEADPEFKHTLEAATTACFVLINGEGDVDTAHRLLAGAIESARAPSDIALVEALHTMTLVCFFSGRAETWAPFYVALDRLGDRVPLSLWLSSRAFADPVHRGAEALARLDEAIDGLVTEADPTEIVRIAIAAVFLDRLGPCRPALWRVIDDGRAGGAVGSAIQAMLLVAEDDLFTGQWDESSKLASEAVGLCETHGFDLFAWPGRYFIAALAAMRGDFATTDAIAGSMIQWSLPRRVRAVSQYFAHARALASLGRGDFEDAFQHAAAISPAGTLAPHAPIATWALFDLVDAAVRCNRRSDAAAHVDAMLDANVARLSPRFALQQAASAALVEPDDATAFELFEHALAIPEAGRWPVDVARVQLAYGERLRRARASVEARAQLRSAQDLFTRLGARPWAARASAELRATGEVKPHTRNAAVESLTPQEREIAKLAAAGFTNKQIGERLFLSHRTVSGHLHRLFPKLGVATRAALRDALESRFPDRDGAAE